MTIIKCLAFLEKLVDGTAVRPGLYVLGRGHSGSFKML